MNARGERILNREDRYEVEGNRLSYLSSRVFGALAGIEDAPLAPLLERPHSQYTLRTLARRGLIDLVGGAPVLTALGERFASRVYKPIAFLTKTFSGQINFDDQRLPRRFWEKAIPEPMGGCWLWLATTCDKGYGMVGVNGQTRRAHRVAFLALRGPIPDELELDHRCRVRCCVNPQHLEAVTHAVNIERGIGNKPLGVCKNGHALTDDNIVRARWSKIGKRRCLICHRKQDRERQALRRKARR